MTIETSTVNVLLVGVLSLQCWIVRKLFTLSAKVSLLIAQCTHCPDKSQFDTDKIQKTL